VDEEVILGTSEHMASVLGRLWLRFLGQLSAASKVHFVSSTIIFWPHFIQMNCSNSFKEQVLGHGTFNLAS
jgi:hypothetical protein